MKKHEVIAKILSSLGQSAFKPQREKGLAFAPSNIALCKYWGKRDDELNLPVTASLSVALPEKGALTHLVITKDNNDVVYLNNARLANDSSFVKRLCEYLDLFRPQKNWYLRIDISMDIPVAAGLASSACGFASLLAAMNDLFAWQLTKQQLSILARLGSGSAARSFWSGFVEWRAGVQADGMDSYGEQLPFEWPELHIGILSISGKEKAISSREAMQRTVNSSVLYSSWPKKVARDMVILRQAIHAKNFSLLAGTAESNALTMHATLLSSWPPICYFLPETIDTIQKIWDLRKNGLEVYFTEDAGPNLKILFLERDMQKVKGHFPNVEIIRLFD